MSVGWVLTLVWIGVSKVTYIINIK